MTATNDERSVSTEEACPVFASPIPGGPPRPHVRSLRRHQRLCSVCNHPEREAIESDFLRWGRPSQIAITYNLRDRASMYRHPHATGLFALRTRNLRWLLERILDRVLERVHEIGALKTSLLGRFLIETRTRDAKPQLIEKTGDPNF